MLFDMTQHSVCVVFISMVWDDHKKALNNNYPEWPRAQTCYAVRLFNRTFISYLLLRVWLYFLSFPSVNDLIDQCQCLHKIKDEEEAVQTLQDFGIVWFNTAAFKTIAMSAAIFYHGFFLQCNHRSSENDKNHSSKRHAHEDCAVMLTLIMII